MHNCDDGTQKMTRALRPTAVASPSVPHSPRALSHFHPVRGPMRPSCEPCPIGTGCLESPLLSCSFLSARPWAWMGHGPFALHPLAARPEHSHPSRGHAHLTISSFPTYPSSCRLVFSFPPSFLPTNQQSTSCVSSSLASACRSFLYSHSLTHVAKTPYTHFPTYHSLTHYLPSSRSFLDFRVIFPLSTS